MKMDLNSLKEFYQAYVASKIPANRKNCPSPRALIKTIEPSGTYRKKRKLIDHISKCSYCKEEFFLVLKVNNHENLMFFNIKDTFQRSDLDVNPIDSILTPSLIIKYASIIIGLFLITFSLFIIKEKDVSLNNLRRRNQIVQLTNPDNLHILPYPLIFKWREFPNAKYYILELFDDTLLPVWTSPKIMKSKLQLPDEILASLKNNMNYYWMISAFSTTEKIAESDLAGFLTLIK